MPIHGGRDIKGQASASEDVQSHVSPPLGEGESYHLPFSQQDSCQPLTGVYPQMPNNIRNSSLHLDSSAQGDWGLQGWSKIMANLGAIGVVCALLVLSFYSMRETNKENVTVFREEMKEFRSEMRAQREHDHELRKGTNNLVLKNQVAMEETLRLVAGLAKDVAALAYEVKTIKKGI